MDILLGEINLNLWKKNWNEIFWNNEYIFFFFEWSGKIDTNFIEFYHETRVHANVSINQLDVITLDYIYNIFEIVKVNYKQWFNKQCKWKWYFILKRMYTWNFNYSLNIYLYVYIIFKQTRSLKLFSKIQD